MVVQPKPTFQVGDRVRFNNRWKPRVSGEFVISQVNVARTDVTYCLEDMGDYHIQEMFLEKSEGFWPKAKDKVSAVFGRLVPGRKSRSGQDWMGVLDDTEGR